MDIEKALEVVNEYLMWSVSAQSVSPKQLEFEQALITLRDEIEKGR